MPTRRQADSPAPDEAPENGPGNQAEATGDPDDTSAPGAVPAAPPGPVRPAPPWYIATEALYVGGNAGAMAVRAFNPGDRVPADLVEPNGWAGKVSRPDDIQAPAPAAEDAATAGQEHADDNAR